MGWGGGRRSGRAGRDKSDCCLWLPSGGAEPRAPRPLSDPKLPCWLLSEARLESELRLGRIPGLAGWFGVVTAPRTAAGRRRLGPSALPTGRPRRVVPLAGLCVSNTSGVLCTSSLYSEGLAVTAWGPGSHFCSQNHRDLSPGSASY